MLHLLACVFLLAQPAPKPADSLSIFVRHKPFGSVLRTVRDSVHLLDDSSYQTLQVETTKSKSFGKIVVRFGIYQDGKPLFTDAWKASTYFEARDHLSDTIKWGRLEYMMKTFFINANFTRSGDEPLDSILGRTAVADIKPGSDEAKEFDSTQHRIFSVYGGRDHLYALTWLQSKKKFVRVWKN